MFSMCSEFTPRAPVPDNRIPQLMQPCSYITMPIKERIGIYVWQSKVKHTLQMIPDHRDTFRLSRHFADHLDTFQIIWTLLRSSRHVSDHVSSTHLLLKVGWWNEPPKTVKLTLELNFPKKMH